MFFMCSQSRYFFFFKQKTAYEMRISDWSSDVCSSDLLPPVDETPDAQAEDDAERHREEETAAEEAAETAAGDEVAHPGIPAAGGDCADAGLHRDADRDERQGRGPGQERAQGDREQNQPAAGRRVDAGPPSTERRRVGKKW